MCADALVYQYANALAAKTRECERLKLENYRLRKELEQRPKPMNMERWDAEEG